MPAFPLDAFVASLPWVAAGLVVLLAGLFLAARARGTQAAAADEPDSSPCPD